MRGALVRLSSVMLVPEMSIGDKPTTTPWQQMQGWHRFNLWCILRWKSKFDVKLKLSPSSQHHSFNRFQTLIGKFMQDVLWFFKHTAVSDKVHWEVMMSWILKEIYLQNVIRRFSLTKLNKAQCNSAPKNHDQLDSWSTSCLHLTSSKKT